MHTRGREDHGDQSRPGGKESGDVNAAGSNSLPASSATPKTKCDGARRIFGTRSRDVTSESTGFWRQSNPVNARQSYGGPCDPHGSEDRALFVPGGVSRQVGVDRVEETVQDRSAVFTPEGLHLCDASILCMLAHAFFRESEPNGTVASHLATCSFGTIPCLLLLVFSSPGNHSSDESSPPEVANPGDKDRK